MERRDELKVTLTPEPDLKIKAPALLVFFSKLRWSPAEVGNNLHATPLDYLKDLPKAYLNWALKKGVFSGKKLKGDV